MGEGERAVLVSGGQNKGVGEGCVGKIGELSKEKNFIFTWGLVKYRV